MPAASNPYLDLIEVLGFSNRPNKWSAECAVIRKKLIWAYSWAIPSADAVQEIARHSPLIEVGAGTGYWSWLLAQSGADILAVDANPLAPPQWYPVEEGGPEVLAAHPERTLFLCWPPLESPLSMDCLDQYLGRRVVYVGELGPAARTASQDFFVRLRAEFVLEREITLPRWPGYQDSLYVFRRL